MCQLKSLLGGVLHMVRSAMSSPAVLALHLHYGPADGLPLSCHMRSPLLLLTAPAQSGWTESP